jgi:hypothetical protein
LQKLSPFGYDAACGEDKMQITSIETTPNPNSMKVNLDENMGRAITYKQEDTDSAPEQVRRLLAIDGIVSVFVCADFITLNKDPRADWKPILQAAAQALTGEMPSASPVDEPAQADAGKNQVFVQTFRGVPIQVKVVDANGESRVSLGEQFNAAAKWIQQETGADYLNERYWADYGLRYGDREQIAKDVAAELQSGMDDAAIEWMKGNAVSNAEESVEQLLIALKDSNPQVRRLSAAALGASGNADAVEPLCDAFLHDTSIAVRRTAGDALSDIGDRRAEPAACEALKDPNKLVRWRAARLLSEIGSTESIPHLESVAQDEAFEVKLESEAAIERIRSGSGALGPAWRRIVES